MLKKKSGSLYLTWIFFKISVEIEELNNAIKSGRVFVVKHVPHSWLFPQISCVVHHGGSGTTHAAVRAGVPSIVVSEKSLFV